MESLSVANPNPTLTTGKQKMALALAGLGVVLLLFVWAAKNAFSPVPMLVAALGLMVAGMVLFVREEYITKPDGIKNNGVWFKSLSVRARVVIFVHLSSATESLRQCGASHKATNSAAMFIAVEPWNR